MSYYSFRITYWISSSNIRGEFCDGYSTGPFYVVSSNKKGASASTPNDNDNPYVGFDNLNKIISVQLI